MVSPMLFHSTTIKKLSAYLLLVLLVGCTSIERRVNQTLQENREKALVEVARPDQWVCHGGCSKTVSAVDGTPESWFGGRGPYVVVPGPHTFVVSVPWSNGWTDQTELMFQAAPGTNYVILTYERASDEPQEKAEVRKLAATERLLSGLSRDFGQGMAMSPLGAFVIVGVGVGYLTYWGVHKLLEEKTEPATGRPFEHCCFVWIQDEESGEVVAGEGPGGEHSISGSAAAAGEQPIGGSQQ